MLGPREILDRVYYGNALRDWLIAAGVLVGVWLVLVVVRRFAIRRLARFAERTASGVDDVVLGGLRRTSKVFLLAVAVAVAVRVALTLSPRTLAALDLVLNLVVLLQGARWGLGAITFGVERVTRRRAQQDKASLTTINVIGVLARVVLWTVLLLLALDAFGIDVTALLTTLGIAGIAVALAVQNVLGDLFASLSIALDKPFVIGDAINVDGMAGTVEDIGLKTTRVRAVSGEQLVFSNADLLKARIRNYRGQSERRVEFRLSVAPETPPEKLERVPAIVRELATAEPLVRFDRSHVSAITETGFVVETVFFVKTGDYGAFMDLQQRVLLGLLRRLTAEEIALTRPVPPVVLEVPRAGREGQEPRAKGQEEP